MLSITETAAQAINTLISENRMPEGSGLRIASQADGSGALQLSVAPAPGEQDTVVEGGGATVFLEPAAAQALDGQLLDVHRVAEGGQNEYQFAITPRESA